MRGLFGQVPASAPDTAPDTQHRIVDPVGAQGGGGLVRRLIRRGARWLVPTSVGSAVISALGVFVPLAIGAAIDTGLVAGDLSRFAWWCGAIALAYALRAGAVWLRLSSDVGGNRAEHELRLTLLSRLLDVRGLGGPRRLPGDLLSVATTDVTATVRGMTTVTSIPGHVVTLGGSLVALVVIDGILALVLLVAAPLLVAVSVYGVRPVRPYTRRDRRAEAEAAGVAADLAAGLRVVRGLGAADQVRERFAVVGDRALAATIRARRVRGVYTSIVTVTVGLFIAALTIVAAYLGLTGRLTIGEVVAVAGLAQTMGPPLRSLGVDTAAVFSASEASADRVLGIIEAPFGREIADSGRRPDPDRATVRFDRVIVKDRIDVPLDLELPLRGILGIVAPGGPAEAIIQVSSGHRRPDAGRLLIGDVDADEVPLQTRRCHLLVPPHHPDLFDESLLDNITLRDDPIRMDGPASLPAVLAATTCDEVAASQPHGVSTRIGEGGHMLSGGQRQRVALARAVYAAPPVLVVHDPTTSVDAATTARIAAGLRQVRHGCTTVLVTTSPQLLSAADDVVLLAADGAIIAAGSHRVLLNDSRYRQALS